MASQTATAVAINNAPKAQDLREVIKNSVVEIGKALPAHMTPERVVRIALTAISTNPELAKCTPQSFMGSLFVLAQLGLEPIAGRAYLLPFNNRRKVGNDWKSFPEVQAVIGYKGYVELFYRHDAALAIDMQTVYEQDEFSYEYGTNANIKHRPAMKERGKAVGYYAIAKLRGGASIFRYMSIDEAIDHGKKHSKTFDAKTGTFYASSPWAKETDAMCMKTVLLQLAKMLPLSVELQRAIAVDETSRDFRKGIQSAIDLPVTTDWQPAAQEAETKSMDEIARENWGDDKPKISNGMAAQ